MKRRLQPGPFVLEALEPRVLLSADGLSVGGDVAVVDVDDPSASADLVVEDGDRFGTVDALGSAISYQPESSSDGLFDGISDQDIDSEPIALDELAAPNPGEDHVGGSDLGAALESADGRSPSLPGQVVHTSFPETSLSLDQNGRLILEAADVLTGTGTIHGEIVNRGLVSPGHSPGVLNVDSFVQDTFQDPEFAPTAGTLLIEIAGNGGAGFPDGHDRINVAGNASLGGTLEVRLLDGFKPGLGDRFDFMSFGSVSGDFSMFSGFEIGDGLFLEGVQGENGYALEVVDHLPGVSVGDTDIITASPGDRIAIEGLFNGGGGSVSIDNVLLRISDFVFISGSLSIGKSPTQFVDVRTGLTQAQADIVLAGSIRQSATDPGGTTLARTPDGSMIWNLPVETFTLGLSGVDVFVGYTDSLAAAAADGDLTQAELEAVDAAGVFLNEVSVGLTLMRQVGPIAQAPLLANARLRFSALRVDAADVVLLGIPEFSLGVNNLQVRFNQGLVNSGTWPAVPGQTPPVVDFALSYPDNSAQGSPDADALPDGFQVRTSVSGDPVALLWDQPLIGVSADNALLRISDFVYVSGGFSFNKGPVKEVDVRTGLTGLKAPQKTQLFGSIKESAFDPEDGSLARTSDGDTIWNLPVRTLDFGLSGVDVFVGYTDSLDAAAADGDLTPAELDDANAIGVFLDEVTLGLVTMQPVDAAAITLKSSKLRFTALKVDADNVILAGVPELTLSAENLQVRLNHGSGGGPWPKKDGQAPPVVDFVSSFPDDSASGAPDAGTLPDGYRVQTSTNGDPVALLWDQPFFGVSADNALLRISDFVYVSGGFSFNKGAVRAVDVRTGLTSLTAAQNTRVFGTIAKSDTDPEDGSLARSDDGSMIWNLPVGTMDVGLSDVEVFVGYSTGLDAAAADGNLTQTELEAADAVGLFLDEVTLGMVMMKALPVSVNGLPVPTFNSAALKFFAVQADANALVLMGVPEVTLESQRSEVRVNRGAFKSGAWPSTSGQSPPAVDFKLSFPDNSFGIEEDEDSDPDGYRVGIDTSGTVVPLLFDSPLIAGAADQVKIRISEFVHITGSVYFEKGPVLDAPLTGLLPTDGLDLGVPPEFTGLENKQLETMTIGALDLNAFVGIKGPYWNDANGNGLIDRDPATGDIVPAEVNTDAIGLVIDDLDFGLLIGKPILPADPIRYVGLKASANNVELVGIEGMTASVSKMTVALNISTPAPGGLPVLPVIDFSALPDEKFGARTGAFNPDGSDHTIDLDMDGPVIRAEAVVALDLFGVVTLSGSIAFDLGAMQRVELTNGDIKEVITMTIGARNIAGFIGLNGPYWTDLDADGVVDEPRELNDAAVGLALTDLDFGIVVMASTDLNAPAAFIGADLNIHSFSFVGLDGIEAEGSLSVQLNLGVGDDSLAPVDFKRSFPDTDGAGPDRAGFEVNTGPGAEPVLIDYDELLIHVELIGVISINNLIDFDGEFRLTLTPRKLEVEVNAELDIGVLGTMVAAGFLNVSDQGIVASLQLSRQSDTGGGLGTDLFQFSGNFQLEINTTGRTQTIQRLNINRETGEVNGLVAGTIAPRSLRLTVGGSLELFSVIVIKGRFDLQFDTSGFAVEFDGLLDLGFFGQLTVKGGAVIRSSVFAMSVDLGAKTLGFDQFGLKGNFNLEINTGSTAITVGGKRVAANTFRVHVDATLKIWVFEAKGSVTIGLENGVLEVALNNLKIDFFGVVTLEVDGFIRSDGTFRLKGTAGFHIGLGPLVLDGGIELILSDSGFSGRAWGSLRIEFSLPWPLPDISETLAGIEGRFEFRPTSIHLGVSVSVFGIGFNESIVWSFGPPPVLATKSGNVLRLNMGTFAHARGEAYDVDGPESFTIRHVGGVKGSETLSVSALGVTQEYSGISKVIVHDAGRGNDTVQLMPGVLADAEINGGSGDDMLIALTSGNVVLRGGDGNDTLTTGSGNDFVFGGGDDDMISTQGGNDEIHGGSGNDIITASAGANTIFGDDGNDQIHAGKDFDIIDGGAGNDTIYGDDGFTDVDRNPVPTVGADDWIQGGPDDDILYGGVGADWIQGGDGVDTIYGEAGDDILFGDFGGLNRVSDRVDSGGNDTIFGGEGSDFIAGGAGSDFLSGGSPLSAIELVPDTVNTIFGDSGFQAGTAFQAISSAFDGNDTILTGSGSEKLFGGGGNDRIVTAGGSNHIFGDYGRVIGTVATGLVSEFDGSDSITSGDGADIIFTGNGGDTVHSAGGDDNVTGGAGPDLIDGGSGNDFLIGGLGDDTLIGGLDNDVLFGGVGTGLRTDYDDPSDFIAPPLFLATEALFPTGFVPPMITPKLVAIEASADGQDTLIGGPGNDILVGGSGVDSLFGDGNRLAAAGVALEAPDDGDDYLDAGSGNDLVVYGAGGNDVLRGGGGNDVLRGGSGIDHLLGEGGNDQLFGQEGIEGDQRGQRLFGGPGNDRLFAFAAPNDPDQRILDGDQLFGGADQDRLQGTIRRELLIGDGGHDDLFGEGGDDRLIGGPGNDFMVGGFGDDTLDGGDDDDVLFGGVGTGDRNDFVLGTDDFVAPPGFADIEARFPTGYTPPRITPAMALLEAQDDGEDQLEGGSGADILIGGSNNDTVSGGPGTDYLSGGGGADELMGGADDDVVRGGQGADVLNGDSGIDQLYGDDDDDILFGGAGTGAGTTGVQKGQRLFGGAGRDELFAFAPSSSHTSQNGLDGDQLFGGPGADKLFGNIRKEVLEGGDGNDYISGDIKAGPNYVDNAAASTTGADDLLLGGRGEDQLYGGGGADTLWGGAGTDLIRGQAGLDIQYGGEGIDIFVLFLEIGVVESVDGHFGNESEDDVDDDDATDILSIDGTTRDDVILLSQNKTGPMRLRIDYYELGKTPVVYQVNMLDDQGQLLVEQIQLAGLAGHDVIGFVTADIDLPDGAENPVKQGRADALDLRLLSERSREFVGAFDGNSGDDVLIGSAGRDRLDGGPGSDTLYGFGGDDRLWGDGGEGSSQDNDVLFAGQGNDDLIGGQGENKLHAWSLDPRQGGQFGVFVNSDGAFFPDSGDITGAKDADGNDVPDGLLDDGSTDTDGNRIPAHQLELTGLNRLLGGLRDDSLFGGTILDFMYGNGGNDRLYRADGSLFDDMDGGDGGEDWKDYARESDQVWYVGGTNVDDEITVDFVTEPGLLSDHHLITRLSNNNGNFSFAAQVRLDFSAADADGNPVWSAAELILDLNALLSAAEGEDVGAELEGIVGDPEDPDASTNAEAELIAELLPPEGDFLVILIDALKGNDTITVGPTVRKTVWIDAGPGDDVVIIRSGNAILVDRAESGVSASGLRGRNDTVEQAYALTVPSAGLQVDGLTIDNPEDTDWFRFSLPATAGAGLTVETQSPSDDLTLNLYRANGTLISGGSRTGGQSISIPNLSTIGLTAGTTYLLEIKTDRTPTIYGIEFSLTGDEPELLDLALRNDEVRRDVILGGDGNDILMGGAGEDWIFGNAGNDVLSGGLDRNAVDLLFGGDGDDTFQIIPDALPLLTNQPNTVFDPATRVFRPQASEQLIGGAGTDRVLFLGGDLDRRGLPVPDYAALSYDTGLHRYEFVSLVWDIGTQSFVRDDAGVLIRHYMFYQTRGIEQTQFSTRAGDDVVNESAPGAPFEDYGIELGDAEQGAREGALIIEGGDGNDILFGGALDDILSGGNGNDLLVGGPGNDQLFGNGGDDALFGHSPENHVFAGVPTFPNPGFDSELYAYDLAVPNLNLDGSGRDGVDRVVDRALDFDANGNDVAFLPHTVLDGLTDVTTTFWFRAPIDYDWDAPGAEMNLVSGAVAGGAVNSANSFVIWLGHHDQFFFWTRDADGNRIEAEWAIPSVWNGAVNHFALVNNDQDNSATLYVNGHSVGSRSLELSTVRVSAGGLVLGQDQDSLGGGFDPNQATVGVMNELAIWNRALSETEVGDVMAGDINPNDSGLNAWYRFNEPAGDAIIDSSGHQPAGSLGLAGAANTRPDRVSGPLDFRTAPGGAILHYSFDDPSDLGSDLSGRQNHSVSFPGIAYEAQGVSGGSARFENINSRILIGDTGVEAGPEWTASAWFRDLAPNPGPWATLFNDFSETVNPGVIDTWQVLVNTITRTVGAHDTSFHDSGVKTDFAERPGIWHQVTAVGAGGETKIYIDGQLKGAANIQGSSTFFSIGNFHNGGQQFAKQLDEVYIYDRALTETEVLNLYDGVKTGNGAETGTEILEETLLGLEGVSAGELLSGFTEIGDFNGDQQSDFIVSGSQSSYILFGPVNLTDLHSVDSYAEIIVDHAALGRPADRFGDVNGDGIADLAFVRQDGSDTLVTVIFGNSGNEGLGTGIQSWDRHWNKAFVDGALVFSGANANARTIRLEGSPLSLVGGISVQMGQLNRFDDDRSDDILIMARSTLGLAPTNLDNGSGDQFDIGFLFSGASIQASSGHLVTRDNDRRIRTVDVVNYFETVVVGNLLGDFEEFFSVGGDLLGEHPLEGITPIALHDLNRDGFDDLAYASATRLEIYLGSSNPTNIAKREDPDLTVVGYGLSAAAGDYNGDGQMDLAVSQTASDLRGGGIYIFYSITDRLGGLISLGDADWVLATDDLPVEGALDFDANQADVAFLPYTALNGLKDVTTTFWFQAPSDYNWDAPGAEMNILSGAVTGDTLFDSNSFLIWMDHHNEFNFWTNDENGAPIKVEWNIPSVADGKRHHFALVNNDQTNRTVLYVDGQSMGTRAAALTTVQLTEGGLVLGQDQDSLAGGFDPVQATVGVLDELTIWNRVLTSPEVGNVMAGEIDPNDPGLNAWYRFNEPAGNELIDSSGHQPAGTLGQGGAPSTFPSRITRPADGLSASRLDLNGDRIHDLAIALAPGAPGQAGQVLTALGSHTRVALPDEFNVIENTSIPGAGSFVVDRGAGYPELFDDRGEPFRLNSVGDEQWFQFSTLGDGQAGNSIFFDPLTFFAEYRFFRFTPVQLRGGDLANGVQLSELQFFLGDTQITGATASNPGGDNPFAEEPAKAVDGLTTTKWLDLNKGALVLDFGEAILIDGYNWATANDEPGRDPVRWTLEGSRDGSDWRMLDDRSRTDQLVSADRFVFQESGPFIFQDAATGVNGEPTVLVDLIDGAGGVVISGQQAFDLRTLEAGTYYLRAVMPDDALMATSFTIRMGAPMAGDRHETDKLPDSDTIHGGAGNDRIVGNYGLDRLFGDGGVDAFTGEPVEIRHRDSLDQADTEVNLLERSYFTVLAPLDPVIAGIREVMFDEPFGGSLRTTHWGIGGESETSGVVLVDLDNSTRIEFGAEVDNNDFAARLSGGDILESITVNLEGRTDVVLSFSFMRTGIGESPDPGDDLDLYYWDPNGDQWEFLDFLPGDGPDMTQFSKRSISLPDGALTNEFRFQFFNQGNEDPLDTWDDWFLDDIEVISTTGEDPGLRAAIAAALGKSPTDTVRASELGSIVELNASGLGIRDITPLRHLLNLRALDLSDNDLTNADLPVLAPKTLTNGLQAGEPGGLRYLQLLDLSGNHEISDVGFLAETDSSDPFDFPLSGPGTKILLAGLETLLLEETRIDPAAANTLATLDAMSGLRILTLPVPGLPPGQNLVFNEGDEVVIPFDSTVLFLDGSYNIATTLAVDQTAGNPGATFEAWVKPLSAINGQSVITTTTINRDWSVFTWNARWALYDGAKFIDTGLSVDTGEWQHLAAVFDTGSQTTRFYKNGEEMMTAGIGSNSLQIPLTIGGLRPVDASNATDVNGFFDGYIGEVRVWDRPLSAVDVRAGMNVSADSNADGLNGYWPIDEGQGLTAFDHTDNPHHGTIGLDMWERDDDWAVENSAESEIAAGTDSEIRFTTVDEGRNLATIGHSRFPIFVRNVAPEIVAVPDLDQVGGGESLQEGKTLGLGTPRTVEGQVTYPVLVDDVKVGDLVVRDAGTADLDELEIRVTVTDKGNGIATDLIPASLHNDGNVYLESDFQLVEKDVQTGVTFSFWFKALSTDEFERFNFPFRLGNTYLTFNSEISGSNWMINNVGGGTLIDDLDLGIAARVGVWHHIAMVAEPGLGIRFYQDGVEFSDPTVGLDLIDQTMALGLDSASLVDDVRIWNRPLSAEELAIERDSPRPVDATSLLSYWGLNEGHGDIARDSSGTGNIMLVPQKYAPFPGRPAWSGDTPDVFKQPYKLPDNGDYRLDITVFDQDGGSAQRSSTFKVTNRPPNIVLSPPAPQGQAGQVWPINEPVSLDASTSSDPGRADKLSIHWAVTTDNGQIIPGSNDAKFTFTPLFSGTYTVHLTVTDQDEGVSTEKRIYTINPVARITTLTTGPNLPGALIELSASNSSPLAPQGPLRDGIMSVSRSHAWTVAPNSGVVVGDRASETLRFIPLQPGIHTFFLTVTDTFADGSLVSETVDIQHTVESARLSIIGSATAVEGAVLNFGTAGLPVLPPLDSGTLNIRRVFAWTASSNNGQVIADGSGSRFSFLTENDGVYTVRLTVRDTIGTTTLPAYSAGPFVVTVANGAPVLESLDDRSILLGEELDLDVLFSDPGSVDTFRYSIGWGDGAAVTDQPAFILPNDEDGSAGRIAASHIYAAEGAFTVTVRVSDGTLEHSDTFTVTVTDQTAPVAAFEAVSPVVRNTAVTRVIVRFSEPVSGVNSGDFALTRGGTAVTGINVSTVSSSEYRVTLPAAAAVDGAYRLALIANGSGITDRSAAANALVEDIDVAWTLDRTAPTAELIGVPSGQSETPAGEVSVLFSEEVTGLKIADFTLTRDGQPVSIDHLDLAQGDPGNPGRYTMDLTTVGTQLVQPLAVQQSSTIPVGERILMPEDGHYVLTFRGPESDVADAAGNVYRETVTAVWTVGARPSVEIVHVTPDPRSIPVGEVAVQFTQDVTGVGIDDFMLTRNGEPVDLSGISLVAVGTTYFLDLEFVTALEGDYVLTLLAASSGIADTDGNPLVVDARDSWTIDRMDNRVVGRSIAYAGSYFDRVDIQSAIAANKTALLPGGQAGFAHYTSYSRGINRVMIDVSDLSGTPSLADFEFTVGNVDDVAQWAALTVAPAIEVVSGAGVGGSERIILTWPDNLIENQWLQVTVKATARTGLANDDVFYFGNAIGESGNSNTDTLVNATDEIGARMNSRSLLSPAAIDNTHDYNRDGKVDATDQILARTHGTTVMTALKLIRPAAGAGGAVGAATEVAVARKPAPGRPVIAVQGTVSETGRVSARPLQRIGNATAISRSTVPAVRVSILDLASASRITIPSIGTALGDAVDRWTGRPKVAIALNFVSSLQDLDLDFDERPEKLDRFHPENP